jgi:hypothetical protein
MMGERRDCMQGIWPATGAISTASPATGIIKPPQSSSHLLPSHRAHDNKTLLIRSRRAPSTLTSLSRNPRSIRAT